MGTGWGGGAGAEGGALEAEPGARLQVTRPRPRTYCGLIGEGVRERENETDYSSLKASSPLGAQAESLMLLQELSNTYGLKRRHMNNVEDSKLCFAK